MTLPRPILELVWAFHRALFRMTGGRVGTERTREGRLGTLFLTTTGRTSGKPRGTAVFYLEDAGRLVVVASNAGADRDPAWWRNLQANPRATVDLAGEQVAVRARRASADEANRLWPRFMAVNPNFAAYRERANRDVAVVVLEVTEPG
jgi:F420H(2)-dependent quinone reductase